MKEKNSFLYILEAIACISVIMIHRKLQGTIGDILIVLARFAVPLFFLISGYYNYEASDEKLKQRAIKLLKTFLIISSIYLGCNFIFGLLTNTNQIQITYREILALVLFNLTNFIEGHLWFIVALIYTYIANIFIPKKCKKLFLFLPIIPVIAFYGLQLVKPNLGGHILTAITRNWITIGIPFYVIGSIIREKENKIKISNTFLIMLIITGMIGSISEFFIVKNILNVKYLGDLYLGTIITTISLFILAIKNPKLVKFKPLEDIGMKYSMIIYLIHPLYIKIINLGLKYFNLEISNIFVILIVFICSYITAYVYLKFSNLKKIGIIQEQSLLTNRTTRC